MNIVDERNATDIVFSDLQAGEVFVTPANNVLYLKISSKMFDKHCDISDTVSNAVDMVNYDLHTFDPRTVVKPIHNATLVLK